MDPGFRRDDGNLTSLALAADFFHPQDPQRLAMTQDWIASAGQPLHGTLDIPGDKSVSHRAVMFAALADGTSTVDGFLEGEDTRATAAIFSRLGVRIETPSPSRRIVHGVGVDAEGRGEPAGLR